VALKVALAVMAHKVQILFFLLLHQLVVDSVLLEL
jgi:hypothetical protein